MPKSALQSIRFFSHLLVAQVASVMLSFSVKCLLP